MCFATLLVCLTSTFGHAPVNYNPIKKLKSNKCSAYYVMQKEWSNWRHWQESTITIRIENYTIVIYAHAQDKQVKNTRKCIAINNESKTWVGCLTRKLVTNHFSATAQNNVISHYNINFLSIQCKIIICLNLAIKLQTQPKKLNLIAK